MSQNITLKIDDGVALITLDDGKANALGSQMWADLNAALDQAEAADAIVILTGRVGVMSGGFDLKEMGSGPQDALELTSKGSKFARRLMAFPRPVIMAAPGHTIAMGAFLSLACDYSMIKAGDFKVGLNETLIGMTMHNFGIEMGRYHLPKSYFNRCVINGEIFSPKGAMRAGFFDRVVPEEQWEMAIPMAGQMFKQVNPEAFKNTKLRSRKEIFKILDQAIKDDLDPQKVHAV
jgi:enoyl-CoA hydratase